MALGSILLSLFSTTTHNSIRMLVPATYPLDNWRVLSMALPAFILLPLLFPGILGMRARTHTYVHTHTLQYNHSNLWKANPIQPPPPCWTWPTRQDMAWPLPPSPASSEIRLLLILSTPASFHAVMSLYSVHSPSYRRAFAYTFPLWSSLLFSSLRKYLVIHHFLREVFPDYPVTDSQSTGYSPSSAFQRCKLTCILVIAWLMFLPQMRQWVPWRYQWHLVLLTSASTEYVTSTFSPMNSLSRGSPVQGQDPTVPSTVLLSLWRSRDYTFLSLSFPLDK